ncbi:MAG: hypothetical protein HWQ58_18190 [Nostoc sp. LPT]|nr:hypothetical protein [Nostoc sp. LPT]
MAPAAVVVLIVVTPEPAAVGAAIVEDNSKPIASAHSGLTAQASREDNA